MRRTGSIINRLLHPPGWVLLSLPLLSFAALALVFVSRDTAGTAACAVYCLSAYSLAVLAAAVPRFAARLRLSVQESSAIQKLQQSPFCARYLNDRAFRGSIGIYQGMAANFLYVIFRIIAGIRYTSVWFVSMAVYYLVLGGLRAYLAAAYRRRTPAAEHRCYRRTAWLLFLLNIPMGGMIVLMVRTNSGFSYPGTIIYLSALYTFYALTLSIINLVRFHRLGSPILSAAKVLNFVAALMSVLGLQTAMISRFAAGNDRYRLVMNTATGGCVYGAVIVIAVYMLLHSRNTGKEVKILDPGRK